MPVYGWNHFQGEIFSPRHFQSSKLGKINWNKKIVGLDLTRKIKVTFYRKISIFLWGTIQLYMFMFREEWIDRQMWQILKEAFIPFPIIFFNFHKISTKKTTTLYRMLQLVTTFHNFNWLLIETLTWICHRKLESKYLEYFDLFLEMIQWMTVNNCSLFPWSSLLGFFSYHTSWLALLDLSSVVIWYTLSNF